MQADPSTMTGSGGGFMVMNNMLYPGVSTFANLIFSDTSLADNTTTVTASGVLHTVTFAGTQGPSMPMTIFGNEASVSHIFSNFYRLALGNNIKGVFVVQSENTAYLILEAINDVSTAHTHALFMLDKKTGADTVSFADLHGTSLDVTASGAMYNAALGTQPLSDTELVFSFAEASDTSARLRVTGEVTFGSNPTPVDMTRNYAVRHIGYNSWHILSEPNQAVQLIITYHDNQ